MCIRDRYQQAIKLTVRQHFVAGLHSGIKAQISAKFQSLDTKEKLLTAAAETEAAVRPRNSAAAIAAIGAEASMETAAISAMKKELDAIRSRFGNLNLQGGGRRSQEAPDWSAQHQYSCSLATGRHVYRGELPNESAGPSAPSAGSGASTTTMSAPAPQLR